jgi:hypothetical protein
MISFERFKEWAERKFGEIVVKNKEIRINSIFETDDDNFHLWCSPSGGKKKRKLGVFHCFKTDKKGSLVRLVQLVEKCDRDTALSILTGQSTISDLERRLEEYFAEKDGVKVEPPKPDLQLPSGSLLISDLPLNNWWRKKAEEYLQGRHIPIDGYFICTEAPYKARIIIPYYDKTGKLIYWNGRHISDKAKLRYLGPPKEVGVGKEDVIYMAGQWPPEDSYLYLCEGEFNAKSLFLSELNAAACGGKNIGEKQVTILSGYKIVLCLDRDKAGKSGTKRMTEIYNSLSVKIATGTNLLYVRPAVGFKDWNEMFVALGPAILHSYILRSQKPITHNSPYGTGADIFL